MMSARRRRRGGFLIAGLLLAALGAASGSHTLASEAPLADAAERHDVAAVRALLDEGADVDAKQADGMTALHWAAYRDELALARVLIDAGADVKAMNGYGVAPLSLACRNGSAALVELLLERGADPETALAGGETALMTAARAGRIRPVELLLERGAKVDATERRGQTALMWAAAEGHVDVARALIAAGADVHASLRSGFTAMFFAVREGKTDVVRALIEAGVDVNAPMEPEKGARGDLRGTSALVLAVENGHFELARVLLEAGADPNDQRSGYAALHVLTWVRKPGVGDDEGGRPAPMGSGTLSSLQLVEALVEHGADVNARVEHGSTSRGRLGRKGATPFLLAAVTADAEYMRLLVELGADPLLPNADGCTPLMAAAGVGTVAPGEDAGTEPEVLEAVKLALELGANVDAVDENGETAMHGAAYKNVPAVVELLAERGADVEVWHRKNRWGWTPLAIAEGYRVGNFKPSPPTVAAFHSALRAAGVEPPASSAPEDRDRKGY